MWQVTTCRDMCHISLGMLWHLHESLRHDMRATCYEGWCRHKAMSQRHSSSRMSQIAHAHVSQHITCDICNQSVSGVRFGHLKQRRFWGGEKKLLVGKNLFSKKFTNHNRTNYRLIAISCKSPREEAFHGEGNLVLHLISSILAPINHRQYLVLQKLAFFLDHTGFWLKLSGRDIQILAFFLDQIVFCLKNSLLESHMNDIQISGSLRLPSM